MEEDEFGAGLLSEERIMASTKAHGKPRKYGGGSEKSAGTKNAGARSDGQSSSTATQGDEQPFATILPIISKVEVLDPDSFVSDPTCLTVMFYDEDHTVGNSLKHIIFQYPEVEFCGYTVPHPLEEKVLIRIQTKPNYNAGHVLKRGLGDLQQIFVGLRHKFEGAMQKFDEAKVDVT